MYSYKRSKSDRKIGFGASSDLFDSELPRVNLYQDSPEHSGTREQNLPEVQSSPVASHLGIE
jgi:hypothetical protein